MRASDICWEKEIEIEIDGNSSSAILYQTEAGNTDLELDGQIELDSEINRYQKKIFAESDDGSEVIFRNAVITSSSGSASDPNKISGCINEIGSFLSVEIDGTDGYRAGREKEVTVEFDMLCFRNRYPHISKENELINENNWRASATVLDNIEERVNYTKSYNIPVRTGKIRVTQSLPGDTYHHISKAKEKVDKISELSRFAQGTGVGYCAARLVKVDDKSVSEIDDVREYVKLYSNNASIGGGFKAKNIIFGKDFADFISESYGRYDYDTRKKLRLQQTIGYYIDALNTTRPIDGRFLSVCSGIELLAKRYSDIYCTQSKTADRIQYLVSELDVDYMDLKQKAGTSDRAKSDEYFYSYSRQYVVHGDNNPTYEELFEDYSAALALLGRIIRNQLIDKSSMSDYNALDNIEASEYQIPVK